ncbi:MAG: DUF488 domain-containing protein [Microthrixaceae bacterium]
MAALSSRIWTRRAYETPTRNDGYRVLVDRMWPRGVSKEHLHVEEWMKDIAPSTELRKWFGHDPALWAEFVERYEAELAQHTELVDQLVERVCAGRVTLVFAAHDAEHNNAVALGNLLDRRTR